MLRCLLTAALTATTLIATAPAADADHGTQHCSLVATTQDTVTGPGNWEGVAAGYVSGDVGELVTIECVLKGGSVESATPQISGHGAAVTAGRVVSSVSDTQYLTLCARVDFENDTAGPTEHCRPAVPVPVPSATLLELVTDEARSAKQNHLDPRLCFMFGKLSGDYGSVSVVSGGDVYVNGGQVYDCPSYGEDLFPLNQDDPVAWVVALV